MSKGMGSQVIGRTSDAAGYLSSKTIAALCSPTGGALCVLRISGSDAFSIAEKITHLSFSPKNAGPESRGLKEKTASRSWIHDENGKKIDDAVLVPFVGPRSFTGEDVVELFLHGSPIIAQKTLDLIFSLGARMALPGEFSFRGVKNGKFSLSQAEAVKEVIAAENDFALDLALEKLSGSQHELIENIRRELMQVVTMSEVGIDFSDQDIDEVSLPRLKIRVKAISNLLKSLQGSFDRGKRFLDGIPVSVFGLPNAGKSSFFNALLGEERSIVSEIAGTTRDVVREKINLKGNQGYVTFKLSDTAGLRKSSDTIEEIGIDRTLKAARESDLILVVVDGLKPHLEEVQNFLAKIDLNGKVLLGILTKSDLVDAPLQLETLSIVKSLPVKNWKWVSSKTLEGIHEVALSMAEVAEEFLERKPGEVLLTRFEHVQAVKGALDCLGRAETAQDTVLFATDLRHGMAELAPLIGETVPDDVLGKIFSDFCIGK